VVVSVVKYAGVCVGAFGRNLASVAVKMWKHLIYFTKGPYKSCALNTIYNDNAELNSINFQRKEVHSRDFDESTQR
jgi:hypothetical protein